MDFQQNIISPETNCLNSSASNRYKDVIETVFSRLNEHLLKLMDNMLVSIEENLLVQANKKQTDKENKKYLERSKIFHKNKDNLKNTVFIHLNNALTTSQLNSETDNTKQTLVDQDEMDEMVAITAMHSKAMSIYGVEVNHLEARLEYLEIMCEEMFDKEAIDPKHLCEVFQKTIESMGMSVEIKLF